MQKLFKKIISGTVLLGIFLGTSFSPFFAQAQSISYNMTASSATESSITFTIIASNPTTTAHGDVNIEYADNSGYTNSSVSSANLNTTQITQTQTVTIGGLNPSTTYYAKLVGAPIDPNSMIVSTSYQTNATGGAGNTQNPSNTTSEGASTFPVCSIIPMEMGGCIARLVYWIFFIPTSFLFSLAGQLMDFSMAYTLDSDNYGKTANGSSFVEKGWTITRDLSNILFIIILMWIAVNIILGNSKDKGLLIKIVWVGLLINFSLFFARLIIDGSNILAKIFYDNMGVDTGGQGGTVYNPWISEGDKSISIAIVSNFNPQKLFSQADTLNLNTGSGVQGTGDTSAGSFIIITIIMSVINLIGMYIFFVVSFVLIGRVVGLWILMIFAPLAFISQILPASASSKLGQFGFSKWRDLLLQQSFLVPVFFFFLYLILLYLNTDFLKGFRTFDNSTTGGILNVIVPLLIIVFLLTKAKKIATDMSGEIGGAMAKLGSTIGGLALGGAIGGYAALGRTTIGKAGQRIAQSETMMNIQRTGGMLKGTWFEGAAKGAAGGIRTGGKALGTATFDARSVAGKQMEKAGISDFGKFAQGGYVGTVDRQSKRQKETADELIKGSDYDTSNQDIRRARRNLDVLMQTHGPEMTTREEALERARKNFEEAKNDGYTKDDPNRDAYGLNEWDRKKKAIEEAAAKVEDYSEKNGIKEAKTQLRNAETARKREEEARKRGQSQEIEATKPKSEEEIKKIADENKKREKVIKDIKANISSGKIAPGTPEYAVAQKDIANFKEGIRKSSYSKKDIWKRIGRRVMSGNEYNQTSAYGTADNQRKGLKDEKKGDDKK